MSKPAGPRGHPTPGAAPPAGGHGTATGPGHVHVFNQCACGVCIPMDAAAALHRQGGDFQQQDAAVVSQINTAAFTDAEVELMEDITAKQDREERDIDQTKETVNSIRDDLQSLRDMLERNGKSLDELDALEQKFNSLDEEAVLIEKKNQRIEELNRDLDRIKKNQEKTIAGYALWKMLCYGVVILVLYAIVSSIFFNK